MTERARDADRLQAAAARAPERHHSDNGFEVDQRQRVRRVVEIDAAGLDAREHRARHHLRVHFESGSVDLNDPANTLALIDRKSTRLNSSHGYISYAVFCLKKKKK